MFKDEDNDDHSSYNSHLLSTHYDPGRYAKHFIGSISFVQYNSRREGNRSLEKLLTCSVPRLGSGEAGFELTQSLRSYPLSMRTQDTKILRGQIGDSGGRAGCTHLGQHVFA